MRIAICGRCHNYRKNCELVHIMVDVDQERKADKAAILCGECIVELIHLAKMQGAASIEIERTHRE